jgi:hypothetical protein
MIDLSIQFDNAVQAPSELAIGSPTSVQTNRGNNTNALGG